MKSKSALSLNDDKIFNLAMDISQKNGSYVLVRAKHALVLICSEKFDLEFKNIFADKQALIERNNNKRDINKIELIFENFPSERKYNKCDYIEGNKVKDFI